MSELAAIFIPKETVSDETVIIQSLNVPQGVRVERGQTVAVLETSKAAVEVEAPVSGYVRYLVPEQAEVAVGEILAYMAEEQSALQSVNSVPRTRHETATGAAAPKSESNSAVRLSARARKLIEEHDLDPAVFSNRGLIREEDVLDFLRLHKTAPANVKSATNVSGRLDAGDGSAQGNNAFARVSPVSKRKQRERAMLLKGASPSMLPSVVAVERSTAGLKRGLAEHPVLHGNVLALVIFEVARLLCRYVDLNAYYEDDQIYYYREVNIGFALDDGRGLVVPVIHEAEKKSLAEVVNEFERLLIAYDAKQLSEKDVSGGTFTISDLSQFPVSTFVPLISAKQSAILGIGGELVHAAQGIGCQQLMLAFDHQVADGRQAAKFLGELIERLNHHERANTVSIQTRPACSSCGRHADELLRMRARLIRTVNSSAEEALICSICLMD